MYCLPEQLPTSIYDRHRCMNYANDLTIADCLLLQELGLPPIVVNRLKHNVLAEKVKLKSEFMKLRLECQQEYSIELQDPPTFKIKTPKQKARLLMMTTDIETEDNTEDYEVPEFVDDGSCDHWLTFEEWQRESDLYYKSKLEKEKLVELEYDDMPMLIDDDSDEVDDKILCKISLCSTSSNCISSFDL